MVLCFYKDCPKEAVETIRIVIGEDEYIMMFCSQYCKLRTAYESDFEEETRQALKALYKELVGQEKDGIIPNIS